MVHVNAADAVWGADGCAGNNSRLSDRRIDCGFGGGNGFLISCSGPGILFLPEIYGILKGLNSDQYKEKTDISSGDICKTPSRNVRLFVLRGV